MRRLLEGVKRRGLLSATIALTFCLSAVLGLLTTSTSDRTDTAFRGNPTGAKTLALTAHAPILIDGNAGFTNASGVVWGSGTEPDPYIIEGWDIDASTANGIEISNTDEYFIIRSCDVHDGGLNHHGIVLGLCANGTLDSNHCSNNSYGIGLSSSSNNTIRSNNCSSNTYCGVFSFSSNNNTISNNDCSNNYAYGIVCFYLSNGNTFSNNNCSANSGGIYIYSSSTNTFSNNSCSNNGDGIWLDSSSGNTLSNNTCNSNSFAGTRLDFSSGNTITLNLISNNPGYGVHLYSGSNNIIWNNTFIGNFIQASDDGTDNWWNNTDSHGNYWSDLTTPDLNGDGIVDWPYNLTGSAGAKDYYPLTTPQAPIPELGMMPLVVMVFLAVVFLITGARRRKAQ